ncbi:hypothetical protein GGE07_004006 [Sinorhizobium terangae]|uniref:Uncharacterized protein n=1 Tax=Sinorhizobium terangae TaxID=110322 RepID=A0A6N7LCJ1_SINTE|nr:hypothetical protein [Sinorhizobium terangae]MBB4187342.1 hypothetical protein [Sinorhizobium terangae]MQX14645.1 hypothetical protein [Sinorhizobium terangae]
MIAGTFSAVLCSWAYRLELDQSALPYDFAFEKPKKGTEVAMAAGDRGEIADAIQFQLRPLFSPSRRPVQIGDPEPAPVPEEVDAAPTAPVAVSARLKLLGTERARGSGTALILDEDSGMSNWVAAGGAIGGWRVLEVRADTVLLASDGSAALPETEPNLTLTLYPEQAGGP